MSNPLQSKLVCIRHGESLWNAKGVWTGWTDIGLSQKGRQEAKTAAAFLADIDFDGAFTSTLVRASETLQIIKTELNIPNLPTFADSAYNERNYGIYTGKNKWDVEREAGKDKFLDIRRGWDVPIPKGESLKDVYNRVIPAYEKNILPFMQEGKNILFVTHGNTIRALIKYLERISDQDIASVEIATGEILIYTLSSDGTLIVKEKRATNTQRGKQ